MPESGQTEVRGAIDVSELIAAQDRVAERIFACTAGTIAPTELSEDGWVTTVPDNMERALCIHEAHEQARLGRVA